MTYLNIPTRFSTELPDIFLYYVENEKSISGNSVELSRSN